MRTYKSSFQSWDGVIGEIFRGKKRKKKEERGRLGKEEEIWNVNFELWKYNYELFNYE